MDESLSDHAELFFSAEEGQEHRPRISCDRLAARKDEFETDYEFSSWKEQGLLSKVKKGFASCCNCSSGQIKKAVQSKIPVVEWLPKYKWRKDFIWDVISGCTVAVMQIPQGLGYAMLGNVPPVIGIYMAFFPVLIYFFFGTSRHISLGTLSVVTLMCGRIVSTYAVDPTDSHYNSTSHNETDLAALSPTQVAMAISLLVGLWQLVMHVLQLGILGLLLSDSLVSGFTTAAAVHVMTSQMKNLLGIRVPKFTGKFAVIHTWLAIFENVPNTNFAALITSVVTITVLVINNEFLKPIYSKRTKVPVPIEMIVLVIGTIISRYGQLKETYGMRVVDAIPTGIPDPRPPPMSILPYIIMDTFSIAVVAYAVSLSMAKIFARKHRYVVDSNQELLAQGLANVGGSFFSSMPVAASLSRSLIQESVGGKSQLASVVSCLLLLLVLLFIGPFFEPLPLTVLSSIIVVALKGMFVQVNDFKKALKMSPYDAFVWASAFLGTVFVDIDLGLVIGVAACLISLIVQGHKPHACLLGHVPGTELYLDISKYRSAVDDPEIKIFHWIGGIHFANADAYVAALHKLVHIPDNPEITSCQTINTVSDHQTVRKVTIVPRMDRDDTSQRLTSEEGHKDKFDENDAGSLATYVTTELPRVRYIVLDLSAVSFIDLAGSSAISQLVSDLKEKSVVTLVVCQSGNVYRRLEDCKSLKNLSKSSLFPTVADAVAVAQSAIAASGS